jgi:hypothetical protein
MSEYARIKQQMIRGLYDRKIKLMTAYLFEGEKNKPINSIDMPML